jgi:hypothetical protein
MLCSSGGPLRLVPVEQQLLGVHTGQAQLHKVLQGRRQEYNALAVLRQSTAGLMSSMLR